MKALIFFAVAALAFPGRADADLLTVAVPRGRIPAEKTAARELTEYLGKMTGRRVVVVDEGKAGKADIHLGATAFAKAQVPGLGAFAIATNATATIGGTDLTFTSNNTHYVDGALTVNCPLVPTGWQVFRGDGTLTLAGGVSAAAGGVRVEGNLTLVPASWVNDVELSAKDADPAMDNQLTKVRLGELTHDKQSLKATIL